MMQETPTTGRADTECFLCAPASRLIYRMDNVGIALCGLGPLVDGYTVVGTREHFRSSADTGEYRSRFAGFTEEVRRILVTRYGSCLLTEHGRVPACSEGLLSHEGHCYHAHFLLFPGAPAVADRAKQFFRDCQVGDSLVEAMELAYHCEEYFLASPSAGEHYILTRPGKLIRQFSRLLVADAIGQSDLANWRKFPQADRAATTAKELRALF